MRDGKPTSSIWAHKLTPCTDDLAGIYNSKRSVQEMKKLKAFEDNLINLIKNVKFNSFRNSSNILQEK